MSKPNAKVVPPLVGTAGSDRLAARFDGDRVYGLAGADVLTSAFNRTELYGGSGRDVLTTDLSRIGGEDEVLEDLFATQSGGAGDDRMTVIVTADSEGAGTGAILNRLDGGGGNDEVRAEARMIFDYGGPAANLINGGAGNDRIEGIAVGGETRTATNRVDAGSGDDTVAVSARGGSESTRIPGATNEVWGRSGNDVVTALAHGESRAENMLNGGVGDDRLEAIAETTSNNDFAIGLNTLRGGAGDDTLIAWQRDFGYNDGTQLTNVLSGGDGHDTIRARITTVEWESTFGIRGLNQVSGGRGDDTIVAEARVMSERNSVASNDVSGGSGDDVVTATAEARLTRQPNEEDSTVAIARNTLNGGAGDDRLIGEIFGENGRSVLMGEAGSDRLIAVGGTDNVLDGGAGTDWMHASAGLDTFVVDIAELSAREHGRDEIFGFDPETDRLAFRGIEDRGAPGLLDDLDAISRVSVSSSGDVWIAFGAPGERSVGLILRDVGAEEEADSFADIVADPASQLILAGDDLFA